VITVDLVLENGGSLVSASASGHALHGSRGTDIVCAAVSVLMRTTLTVLESGGARLRVESAGRGSLSMTVLACTPAGRPLLDYAGAFLHQGIGSLAVEYPESVRIREKRVSSSIEVLEE